MYRVPASGGELELETTLPFEGDNIPFSLARDRLRGVAIETSYQTDLMFAQLHPETSR